MKIIFITIGFFMILSTPSLYVKGQGIGFFDPIPSVTLDTTELVVIYRQRFSPDSTNIQNIVEFNSILFLGSNISLYQCLNSYNREKILQGSRNLEELRQGAMHAPTSPFTARFYKNYPEGRITTTDRIMGDLFKYQENLNMFSWTIHNEKSVFNGFRIQKASCSFGGRDWIAWFSAEIPYRHGPHKFYGLPGLILKLYDTRGHFHFEVVSVEKANNSHTIEFPKRNFIETTKRDFFRARESFRQSIIQGTNALILDPHTRQVASENLRRSNNRLELNPD